MISRYHEAEANIHKIDRRENKGKPTPALIVGKGNSLVDEISLNTIQVNHSEQSTERLQKKAIMPPTLGSKCTSNLVAKRVVVCFRVDMINERPWHVEFASTGGLANTLLRQHTLDQYKKMLEEMQMDVPQPGGSWPRTWCSDL